VGDPQRLLEVEHRADVERVPHPRFWFKFVLPNRQRLDRADDPSAPTAS
jgi:hypothetical protein